MGGNSRGRVLVAAGVLAIVAAAGVVAVSQLDSEPSRAGAARAPARTTTTTLTGTDDGSAVVLTETHAADGTIRRTWLDEATGSTHLVVQDAQGRPLREELYTTTAHVVIDYLKAEYTVTPTPAPASLTSSRAADQMKRRIDSGELVADGSEVVDGRTLLRYVPLSYAVGPEPGGKGVMWVEPGSPRPIKELHAGGTVYEFTQSYTYLERTEANLALLGTTIPAAFTEVEALMPDPPVPGSGDRIDHA